MFLEQASVWNFQAERLNQASLTANSGGVSQQVPWSSSVDGRGRPTFVFGENKVASKETVKAHAIKKRLKESREWEHKRPVAEEKAESEKRKVAKAKADDKDCSSESQEDSSSDDE